MHQQPTRLLALARSGDGQARCEIARRYLLGSDGFPRHLDSGIEFLQHPAAAALPAAAQVVADCLRLEEILQAGLLSLLQRAVDAGLVVAQTKLGAWWLARHPDQAQGAELLTAATRGQCEAALAAREALAAMAQARACDRLAAALRTLARHGLLDARAVAEAAARQALATGDRPALGVALACALSSGTTPGDSLAALLVEAVADAETEGGLEALPPVAVEALLEARACAGDRLAAHALGRALCGMAVGRLPAQALAAGQNLRKGSALLLRAADAGCDAAWLQLYRLHADHRLSVANPPMARFFLEKAAHRNIAEAQRHLGALMLRGAATLQQTEAAIAWLYRASGQGDEPAHQLLASLVLPVGGDEAVAGAAIAEVAAQDAELAGRLRVARAFGLTKQEALSLDPVAGLRPWGLVVERNPFIAQNRVAAPRAVPALTRMALAQLRAVAAQFAAEGGAAAPDWRRRAAQQRRLFMRLGVDEGLFFATANAQTLDSLRLGSKWAFRARQTLRQALSA